MKCELQIRKPETAVSQLVLDLCSMALGNPITWVIIMWKEDIPGQVFVPNNWEVAQNTSPIITEEASVHLCTSHDHNTLQCHTGPEYCSSFCSSQETLGRRVYSFSE